MPVESEKPQNPPAGAQPGDGAAPPANPPPPANQPAGDDALLGGEKPADPKASGEKPKDGQPQPDPNKPAEQPKPLELKIPEGFTKDAPLLKQFSELAGKTGLKGEQAQAILDLYAGDLKREMTEQAAEREAQDKAWIAQMKKDAEVGGDKFDASKRLANVALERIGGKELVELVKTSGLRSNPVLFKFMVKVGQLVAEDRIDDTRDGPPAGPKPPTTFQEIGERLYGSK